MTFSFHPFYYTSLTAYFISTFHLCHPLFPSSKAVIISANLQPPPDLPPPPNNNNSNCLGIVRVDIMLHDTYASEEGTIPASIPYVNLAPLDMLHNLCGLA